MGGTVWRSQAVGQRATLTALLRYAPQDRATQRRVHLFSLQLAEELPATFSLTADGWQLSLIAVGMNH